MMPRALVVFLFLSLGCASAQDTAPLSEDGADEEDAPGAQTETADRGCEREATVAVRVDNQSTMDMQLTFGSYRAARVAEGFSRTTYQIPRAHLRTSVRIQILRGGVRVGAAPLIQTEAVVCNHATLVIGSRPQYSIFYGDALLEPVKGGEGGDEGNALEAAEEAPADSASSEPSG